MPYTRTNLPTAMPFSTMPGAEGHDHAASRSARCILLALQSSMSARRGDTVLLPFPSDRVPFLRRLHGESGCVPTTSHAINLRDRHLSAGLPQNRSALAFIRFLCSPTCMVCHISYGTATQHCQAQTMHPSSYCCFHAGGRRSWSLFYQSCRRTLCAGRGLWRLCCMGAGS